MSNHDQEVFAFDYGPGVTIVTFPQNYTVNWNRVLNDLEPFITMVAIAERIDKPLATLKYWKYKSQTVPFEDGLEIIAMWCKYSGKPADLLPKTEKIKKNLIGR